MSDVSLKTTVKVLQRLLASICILWSYTATYINYLHAKQVYSQIKRDYELLFGKNELEMTEKYNKEGKMYAYIIVGFCNFYFIATVIPSVINVFLYYIGNSENVNLTLPIPVNNVSNPGAIFYTLFIYQALAIYITTTLGSVCFASYLLLVQHACCQLTVLRLKIDQPFRDHQKLNQMVWFDKINCDEFGWIVDVIERYKRTTKFVDLLNSASKNIYLILMNIVVFLIALDFLYMFHLSTDLRNTWELIECSIYVVGSIFTTYINMYLGQTLMNHSIETHAEFCKIPFYMISIKSQKLLVFMILRSSKPCVLSIGGIFVSSHELFAGLMRKAFSFAMAYRSIR